ncbi:MAG: CpaE-like family protein [Actinomycetia bacterium]|nr:CpaE-like family protein [Actinomycetes bacterium]
MIDDQSLNTDIDRVAAAAGLQVVRTGDPSSQRVWNSAAAILLDTDAARRCGERGFSRRPRVFVVGHSDPDRADWEAAVAVGAQQVVTLPKDDRELMAALSSATEAPTASHHSSPRGPIAAVLAGRGGAGASVFATALAQAAAESLLIDGDPWGGGLDLVLGTETESGLRWPDLSSAGGRLNYPALKDALPGYRGVSLLSASRVFSGEPAEDNISSLPLAAVIDAGSRAGVTVVCDLARQRSPATETALAAADLVVLVTTADVRSCAASAATAQWASAGNLNTAVLVRGPSPGGLRPVDIARILGLPVLASMRPEPGLRQRLERGGLRLRRRSPLANAANKVLEVLGRSPHLGHANGSAL